MDLLSIIMSRTSWLLDLFKLPATAESKGIQNHLSKALSLFTESKIVVLFQCHFLKFAQYRIYIFFVNISILQRNKKKKLFSTLNISQHDFGGYASVADRISRMFSIVSLLQKIMQPFCHNYRIIYRTSYNFCSLVLASKNKL